ncbi:MAG: hypothetical protein JWQ90_738 [Hydrocarboniphaga sp.]|uniref:hypothetical protein n=1 Tax=Hydrocarboniphaga sp. TaxID=2033016 RepID=UPI00260C1A0E|nr:hypothetical protein [Hydrocarboniphaga sp.]MDB5968288.1 hypothetical protein [Hydrocarboniphaga sp.]
MITLLLWVATLAGGLLIAAGIVGSHPRPSDGQWRPLSPSLRAGLSIVGLMVILGGWALNQGWFKAPKAGVASGPLYSEARADRPIDSLWNEAEVAEREARQHPRRLPAPSESATSTPAAAPTPIPTPASTPAAVPTHEPTRLPEPVPAPPSAPMSAAVATTPGPAAPAPAQAAAKAPACDCDPPDLTKPLVSKSVTRTQPGRHATQAIRSDVVSVCALQRQYGIGDSYRGGNGTSSLRVQDRLGPQQRREQLRITVDGAASAALNLGPSASSGSVSLRVPRGGARYRLSGFTEYHDGHRVALSGEGFVDGSAPRYELRLADELSGSAFLEPAP